MIRKLIIQIFLKVEKNLHEFPLFEKNKMCWQIYANNNGFDYLFIDDLNYDSYLGNNAEFYNSLEFTWQKIDMLRYLAINQVGGIYIDLDISPKVDININELLDQPNILNKWYNPKTEKYEITNSIMGFEKGSLESLISYCKMETNRCRAIPCYKVRKIRYMLHTTGVRAFKRWCKLEKIGFTHTIHSYITDHCASTWTTEKFG